jgi:hypothetical protein
MDSWDLYILRIGQPHTCPEAETRKPHPGMAYPDLWTRGGERSRNKCPKFERKKQPHGCRTKITNPFPQSSSQCQCIHCPSSRMPCRKRYAAIAHSTMSSVSKNA